MFKVFKNWCMLLQLIARTKFKNVRSKFERHAFQRWEENFPSVKNGNYSIEILTKRMQRLQMRGLYIWTVLRDSQM